MATLQLFFELPLNAGIGQTRRSVAGDQVVPIRRRPVFGVVIERDPVARLSALGILLDLSSPGCPTKHGLVPGIHAMHPLVVRPAYEAGAQGRRKAFERGAVPVSIWQFRRYVNEHLVLTKDVAKNLRTRSAKATGEGSLDSAGPGDIYEIDATGGRIVLVTSGESRRVIAQPTIYVILDRWSRFIVSIYVSLKAPSWDEARYAVLIAFTSREKRFSALGVDINDKRWPVGRVCSVLRRDRGSELTSESMDKAVSGDMRIDPSTLPSVSRGRTIKLKVSDYTWPNSITRGPMRAGIRFDMFAEQKTNYDFVKILIHDGKVWAIWRDDTTSTYAYEKTIGDMSSKYAGAAPINDYFDILVNGQRKSDGTKTLTGFELYQGACSDNTLPFGRVNQSDSMRLENGCNKVFRLNYGVISTAGVKSMGNGSTQLVDLDAGRAFFASMANAAANSAAKEATTGAKL